MRFAVCRWGISVLRGGTNIKFIIMANYCVISGIVARSRNKVRSLAPNLDALYFIHYNEFTGCTSSAISTNLDFGITGFSSERNTGLSAFQMPYNPGHCLFKHVEDEFKPFRSAVIGIGNLVHFIFNAFLL